jgi:L-alanine-DL-glutamate epimerase-like enolase superfamily enzyme
VSSVLGAEPRRWSDEIASLGSGELPVVKCKIGRDLGLELRCLGELRARWPLLRLRLDANGTLAAAELSRLFEQFFTLGVELVEEPLAGPALFALPRLAVPHAIDESLAQDVERALESAAGAVVIKPATTGLLEARGLALRADRAGKGVILTHLFDGPWALAAVRELAVALPFRSLPCGLAEHAALAAYPRRLVPRSPRGSTLLAPSDHVGLGVAPP